MTLRTLLLGSAAAVLMAGGAQAADLGAEPVNYVKVCDAFGAGYYYAPGTDTCVRISGWVRFDVNLKKAGSFDPFVVGVPGDNVLPIITAPVPSVPHAYVGAAHQFQAGYSMLSVQTAAMTEYGPTTTSIGIGIFNTGTSVDHATLSLGPLSAGYAWSSYAGNFQTYHDATFSPLGMSKANFVQLSWAMSGVGLFLAAEDYRTRDGAGTATGNLPDIVGGISFGLDPVSFRVTAGYGDRIVTDTYGVHGEIGVGLAALGQLSVQASYSANADDWASSNAGGTPGNYLGIYASLATPWSAQVSSLLAGVWYDGPALAADYTRIIGQLQFSPVRNFTIGAEVSHTMPAVGPDSTTGIFRLSKGFP